MVNHGGVMKALQAFRFRLCFRFWLVLFCGCAAGPLRGEEPADSFRLVVGFEKAAAVSSVPVQKLFVDLYFDRALAGSSRARAWGDLRLGSLPRTIDSTALSLPGDVASAAAGATLNELTQSGEFLVGAEYRVTRLEANRSNGARVSLIASYGASTPLAPVRAGNAPVVPALGRNAFQRQYYGGLRVGGLAAADDPAARHVVDIAIGQNDAVTGGAWRGTVVRIDSFFSLPVSGDVFYLYGTALVKTSGAGRGGAGASPTFSQDVYRVGAGIDVVQLLKVLRAK